MAPKKQNAFMVFVSEWRQKNAKNRKLSVQEAVAECGDIWRNMNAQQRGPYNSIAKNADVSSRCNVEPLNCQGQAMAEVARAEKEAAEREMRMKRTTERLVLAAKERNDLENIKFVFAAFNYFTKSIGSDIYIPAEFSACQFSLKSGICSVYSSHINPGQLIFGQGSETIHHTNNSHQLPLPPNALGESNIGRLYANIVEYLRKCNPDAKPNDPLIVFTTTELMPVVKGCFRYLESDSEEPLTTILIYDIQYLLYVLKMEVLDSANLPSGNITKSTTDNLFINDYFCYHLGISCQFHEDIDRCKYCTQSIVSRWCYLFSDHMCGDLAITPQYGKHMPPKQELMFHVTNPDSQMKSNWKKPSANNDTFSSFQSDVKHEIFDHSTFSDDLNGANFPSLGAHKSKSNRRGLAPRDPRNVWNVPSSNFSAKDFEDSFNMPRP